MSALDEQAVRETVAQVINRLHADLAAARAENERLREAMNRAKSLLEGTDYYEGSRIDRALGFLDAALASPAQEEK